MCSENVILVLVAKLWRVKSNLEEESPNDDESSSVSSSVVPQKWESSLFRPSKARTFYTQAYGLARGSTLRNEAEEEASNKAANLVCMWDIGWLELMQKMRNDDPIVYTFCEKLGVENAKICVTSNILVFAHIFRNQALTDKISVKISAKIQPPYESVAHSNGSSSTSSLS